MTQPYILPGFHQKKLSACGNPQCLLISMKNLLHWSATVRLCSDPWTTWWEKHGICLHQGKLVTLWMKPNKCRDNLKKKKSFTSTCARWKKLKNSRCIHVMCMCIHINMSSLVCVLSFSSPILLFSASGPTSISTSNMASQKKTFLTALHLLSRLSQATSSCASTNLFEDLPKDCVDWRKPLDTMDIVSKRFKCWGKYIFLKKTSFEMGRNFYMQWQWQIEACKVIELWGCWW